MQCVKRLVDNENDIKKNKRKRESETLWVSK